MDAISPFSLHIIWYTDHQFPLPLPDRRRTLPYKMPSWYVLNGLWNIRRYLHLSAASLPACTPRLLILKSPQHHTTYAVVFPHTTVRCFSTPQQALSASIAPHRVETAPLPRSAAAHRCPRQTGFHRCLKCFRIKRNCSLAHGNVSTTARIGASSVRR